MKVFSYCVKLQLSLLCAQPFHLCWAWSSQRLRDFMKASWRDKGMEKTIGILFSFKISNVIEPSEILLCQDIAQHILKSSISSSSSRSLRSLHGKIQDWKSK